MKTITTMCDRCWSISVHPVYNTGIPSELLKSYIEEHIELYERMYQWGIDSSDHLVNSRVYEGKLQALRELKWNLEKGHLYES